MSEFNETFELNWHGNTVVITPASDIENLKWDLIEQAAEVIMTPMREMDVPMVVFDLSGQLLRVGVPRAVACDATSSSSRVPVANWFCAERRTSPRNC